MKGPSEEKTIKKPRDNGNKKNQADVDDQGGEGTGILHSMEDLRKTWSSAPEPKLQLPNPSSIAPAEMAKQVDKIDQDQKTLRDWTIGLLGNIDQRLAEVAQEENPQKRKIALRLATDGNKADQALFDPYLRGEKYPFYHQAVWVALFEYYFTKPHQSQVEVQATVKKLVEEKYLTEDPAGGQLKAYEKTYNADPALGDEVETVRKYLNNLISNVLEVEKKSLFARANLTPAEFLAGKTGRLALTIHAEPAKDQNGKIKFWMKGGDLLVESDGRKVWAIAVSGGIEKTIKEGMALKSWFFRDTLSNKKAPTPSGVTDDEIKKIHSLWHIVRRGLLRHKFAVRANISRKEFFLEGKTGTCYLEYEGTWDMPDNGPRLANFFFLLIREEKEGVKRIHLEDAPDHLKDFFAGCTEWYPEERVKFGDVPQPLQAVLQAGFGQTQKSEQKSAQIVG